MQVAVGVQVAVGTLQAAGGTWEQRGLPRGSKKSVDKGEPRRTSWWRSSGHFIREEYLACRGREKIKWLRSLEEE